MRSPSRQKLLRVRWVLDSEEICFIKSAGSLTKVPVSGILVHDLGVVVAI
jgi:hypothetical protein